MDISKLSVAELKALQEKVAVEIQARKATERQEVLNELKALAEAKGFSLEELIKAKGAGAKKGTAVRTVAVKYRHPENPALAWTGRGRQPAWVVEWLKSGKTLDAVAV